ncbi:uncharacterized protein BJ212DRAFT_1296338 [Suillus subaureus]|uniref:Uncharacterized protein n=1 Tax=Suillus subaureus TaxID=48587 RepID=A0A9P7EK58_9AGAM|nr:uncharacterized protein BJ212DRAFT_1296338 [Suillus subaureus]KAG1823791.1 hypothetical protein BJ212DRAFT_1296338 [Suillus subaureus]
MAHKQDPPVSMSRQCLATKRWLAKPGYFRVQDMQNAKACVRMANTTPEVNNGSILTMENDLPCSCNSLTLQDIKNMANCWQKGWVEKSEHLWDGAYQKLLEEVKFFEVKVANSKTK